MEAPEINEAILCSVCISGLAEGNDGGVVSTPCGHLFHKNCLKEWFVTSAPRSIIGPEQQVLERLKGPCPICTSGVWFKRCNTIYLNLDTDQKRMIGQYVNSMEEKLKACEKRVQELEAEKKYSSSQKQIKESKAPAVQVPPSKKQAVAGSSRGKPGTSAIPPKKLTSVSRATPSTSSAAGGSVRARVDSGLKSILKPTPSLASRTASKPNAAGNPPVTLSSARSGLRQHRDSLQRLAESSLGVSQRAVKSTTTGSGAIQRTIRSTTTTTVTFPQKKTTRR